VAAAYGQNRTESRHHKALFLAVWLVASVTLLSVPASAQVAPWIAPSLFEPSVWDSSGPYADSPWYHAPPQTPGDGWGLFSPKVWRDGSWKEQSNLTGNWGGARSTLFSRYGVALVAGYGGQISGNPVGGEQQGETYIQRVGAGLFIDLNRMMGWRGGYFVASMNANWGDSLSTDYVGNFFQVQYSQGNPSARLVDLALVQSLGRFVEVALGRLVMANDFGGGAAFCASVNQAVCSTPINATSAVSFGTFPYATWGGRVKVKPSASWYFQAGVYATYPSFRNPDDHGVNFGLPDGSGPMLLAEAGWIHGSWRLFKGVEGAAPPEADVSGYGGKIKFGGYASWETLTDLRTQQPYSGAGWGLYVIFEQDLYLEDDAPTYAGAFGLGRGQGLDGFLSISYASEETSPMPWMVSGGLIYQGLLPGRDNDVTTFVAVWGRFSDDLRAYQQATNQAVQDYEVVLEMNYRFNVTGGFFLQPDIQGVIRPSGLSNIPDALVLSLNFGLAL